MQTLHVSMTDEGTEIMNWVANKMKEEELEKEFPALKSARDQYEMIKNICISDRNEGQQ